MKPAALIFASLTLFVSGCASNDSIVKIYEDPGFDEGPFDHVLVVGAYNDIIIRRQGENALAAVISATGSDATPSLAVMEAASGLDRNSVVAAAGRVGADAVLVARVLDVETSIVETDGRSTTVAQRRDDIPLVDFFRYDYETYADPMTYSAVRTVILSSDLYDVDTEARIWSVESTSFEKESTSEIIDGASRQIAAQLRADGLIR
ncbi:MAG: hypothetical protein ACR2QQ_10730 [Gammaproteobacteria bacterium]